MNHSVKTDKDDFYSRLAKGEMRRDVRKESFVVTNQNKSINFVSNSALIANKSI